MKNKRNIINLLLLVLCIMTIGYATFSSNLVINGNATIDSKWDVEITGISAIEINGGAKNENTPIVAKTKATFSTLLKSPGDYVIYEITVMNKGSIDARLNNIEKSDEKNPAINFIVDGIQKDDVLNSLEKTKFTVKVMYNDDVTSQPESITSNFSINLNYVQK